MKDLLYDFDFGDFFAGYRAGKVALCRLLRLTNHSIWFIIATQLHGTFLHVQHEMGEVQVKFSQS